MAIQALSQIPEVRAELVAEIKRELQEGSFRVDPELIADRLLAGGL